MQSEPQYIIQDRDEEAPFVGAGGDAMDTDHAERESLLQPRLHSPSTLICREPHDRFNLVFIIFLYLGVAMLLPWNFFITAKHYFDYKFRNTSLPDDVPYDVGNATTSLQTTFESYLSLLSMGANLIFITLAMILVRSISINGRILISLLPIITIFIITDVFVDIDTDSWQTGFFWFSLMSAALMVGLTAVMTGSIFGLSCLFAPRYTQALMAGQAVGGTLSAVVNIVTIAIGEDPKRSSFWFFLTATVCSALALVAYFSLYYLKYSKFFMANQQDVDKRLYDSNMEIPSSQQLLSKQQFFSAILRKTWAYFTSVCLVFLVTLACFPAVVSLITSVNYTPGDPWTDTYFTPVACFLLFNLCDLLGRTATHWVKFPRNGQKVQILCLSLMRVAFIPLFMLCNIDPGERKYLPVLLRHDAWPIVLNVLLGLSNGYIGTLCMLHGPSQVDLDHAEGAGMVMTFGMTLGLAVGSLCSLLLVSLI